MNTIQLDLQVIAEDQDAEALQRLTGQLREELRGTDLVEEVQFSRQPAPDGVKSSEEIIMGFLVVSLLPTMLDHFMGFLKDWTLRREGRSMRIKFRNKAGVEMEVEFSAAMSEEDVRRMIALFEEHFKELKKNG